MPTPSSSTTRSLKRARPKGLWKARAILSAERCIVPNRKSSDSDSDHDLDEFESVSSSTSSHKRRRRNSFSSTASSDDEDPAALHWDFARFQTCRLDRLPERELGWTRRQRIMDTTSTAFAGSQTELKSGCELEDWLDLKDLFAKAAEQYETGGPSDALPLLRGVVHECHSFLTFYEDPSVLFSGPRAPEASPKVPPPPSGERSKHEWAPPEKRKCTCLELPTAFHAILGTALFLFGNLIDQDGSLALPGEPCSPIPYWLAALDVFETGENLPSRVYGTGCDAPEDWRMAIIWGRTLVALADATISQSPGDPQCTASFSADEPTWPDESPFAAIAMRRPAFTRRMLLSKASPNSLMVLAMDQFSRGMFHMPHPQHAPRHDILMKPPSASESFSRPKELYTVASEVMLLAQKLPHASERQFWASWADSVLNQMKMEADMDSWRGIISRARGKCWLIAGTAYAPELEEQLLQDMPGVLDSEDAEDARSDLGKAIEFLGKGRSDDPEEEEDRKKMLAEAFMTLGNLTADEDLQEALYRRGEEEGGLDLDRMDVDE